MEEKVVLAFLGTALGVVIVFGIVTFIGSLLER